MSFEMGRRQAVRHWILIPAFGGSIPPAPATFLRIQACQILKTKYSIPDHVIISSDTLGERL